MLNAGVLEVSGNAEQHAIHMPPQDSSASNMMAVGVIDKVLISIGKGKAVTGEKGKPGRRVQRPAELLQGAKEADVNIMSPCRLL